MKPVVLDLETPLSMGVSVLLVGFIRLEERMIECFVWLLPMAVTLLEHERKLLVVMGFSLLKKC